MSYPGRAAVRGFRRKALARHRKDQIESKRARVKERLSQGRYEDEARNLANLMGMSEKEAMQLISDPKLSADQKIEQHYDFDKLARGPMQDIIMGVTSDVGVGIAGGTTMTAGAAGLIALMNAMQGAQNNQVQREAPLQ